MTFLQKMMAQQATPAATQTPETKATSTGPAAPQTTGLDGMFKDFEKAMKDMPKQPEGGAQQPNAGGAGGPFDGNFMSMFENLAK
jgi:hypothetical protein